VSETTPEPRAYPLPPAEDDERFTYGLTLDVAAVLAEHGYPEVRAGLDLVDLQQALHGFIHARGCAVTVAGRPRWWSGPRRPRAAAGDYACTPRRPACSCSASNMTERRLRRPAHRTDRPV
jgi:hypothetical protein